MFHKTSSRIKRFILLKKDQKTWQEDDLPQSERRKLHVKAKSCTYQDQESTETSFVRRTNSSPGGQPFSAPSQRPQATELSLSTICKYGCNATPPHSLLKCQVQSNSPKRLCQRPHKSMRLIVASSDTTFLHSASPLTELYHSRSTTQLDLLQALALEPGGDNDWPSSGESSDPWKLNSDDYSKDAKHVHRTEKCSLIVPGFTITNMSGTNSELCLKQDSSKPPAGNLSPRTEPRGRFRRAVSHTISITRSKQSGRLKDDHNDQKDSDFMKSLVLKPPALSNSPETLEKIRKRLSAIHSRQSFKHNITGGRAGTDRTQQLRIQTFAEDNYRPSSETSHSTESESTGSTPLEPFHLEDLPLRIRLDAGFLTERKRRQHIQVRHSTASIIAPQPTVPSVTSPPNVMNRNSQVAGTSEREVILRSTNYSLTSSGFRHGDIRLKRRRQSTISSEARCSAPQSSIFISSTRNDWLDDAGTSNDVENRRIHDEMDVSGFQIAISGSTGCNWVSNCEDCPNDDPHSVVEDREVKLDELLEWWSLMNLDAGALLQHDPDEERWEGEPQTGRRQQPCEEARGSHSSELNLAPLETYQGSHITGDAGGVEEPIRSSRHEFVEGSGEDSTAGRHEKGKERTGSEASLPPSPMHSIDPNALSTVDTFVPMGFNIDHDLADFLRWRSECVHSTAGEL